MGGVLTAALVVVAIVGMVTGVLMGFGVVPGAQSLVPSALSSAPTFTLSTPNWKASGTTVTLYANGAVNRYYPSAVVTLHVGSQSFTQTLTASLGTFQMTVTQVFAVGTYSVYSSGYVGILGVNSLSGTSPTVTLTVKSSGVSAQGGIVALASISQNPNALSVSLTDTSTVVNGASVNLNSTQWAFSDGIQLSGASVTRTFPTAGVYSVVMSVSGTASGGGVITNSTSQPVTVWPASCENCPLAFSPSFAWSANNLSASFQDYTTVQNGQVISYNWSFGDGTFGFGSFTPHVYAKNGTYAVTETVTAKGLLGDTQSKATTTNITITLRGSGGGCSGTCSTPSFVLTWVNGAIIGVSFGLLLVAFVGRNPWAIVGLLLAGLGIGAGAGLLI